MSKSEKAKEKGSRGTDKRPIPADAESNILRIVAIEKEQKESRTIGEKVAERIAAFCGSVVFVYVHIVWFGAWITVNSIIPAYQFDPFPYTFLTLVVSLEAIFLSTFILISQNHETKLTERRNHLDLQINMLAEEENTKMLELIQAIAKKVGVDFDDGEVAKLLEPIDPERLVKEIISASDEKTAK